MASVDDTPIKVTPTLLKNVITVLAFVIALAGAWYTLRSDSETARKEATEARAEAASLRKEFNALTLEVHQGTNAFERKVLELLHGLDLKFVELQTSIKELRDQRNGNSVPPPR